MPGPRPPNIIPNISACMASPLIMTNLARPQKAREKNTGHGQVQSKPALHQSLSEGYITPILLSLTSFSAKNRYMLIELVFEPDSISAPTVDPITERLFTEVLRESLQLNFGDIGAGQSGTTLNVKYYSPATSLLILRCSRSELTTVRAALFFITHLNRHPVICRTLHCSGASSVLCFMTSCQMAKNRPFPRRVYLAPNFLGTIRKTQEATIEHDRRLILSKATNHLQADTNVRHQVIMKLEP